MHGTFNRLFGVLWLAAASAAQGQTLEQIMDDPDWIARPPESAYWAWDGSAVLYERKREGSPLRDLWRIDPDGGEPAVVADDRLPFVSARGGVPNPGRTRKAFARSGDIFIRDLTTGGLTQLTRTTDDEHSPMFMADGSVAFTRGGAWFIIDPAGAERQAADIRLEDEPEKDEDEDKPYLTRQQHRLFEIIRLRESRKQEREDRDKARRDADPTRVPGPFYLGDGRQIGRRSLSPSGRWMLLSVREDPGTPKRDIISAYVNEDGYVSTHTVRPHVGEEKRASDSLVLLDLAAGKQYALDASALPMITDDPLAWLKEKNKPKSGQPDADDAPAPTAGDAAPGDAGDAPADEPGKAPPRPFTVQRIAWNPDGSRVAAMLRSNDNKDRWIVSVDLDIDAGGPALVPIHHLRDEAWINWRYNEFGWTRDGAMLWYLSEETGYGHLYAWHAATGETTPLTAGRFTVHDVSESPAGGVLYYRANRDNPGVYELERVGVGSGETEKITAMGGTVESYALSPDGSRVLAMFSTAMDPPELYVLDAVPGATPTRLTHTATDLFRSFDWIAPEFVGVPSSHGAGPIPCRVYEDTAVPAGPSGKPVVLFSHGSGYTQHVYNGWSYYFREHLFHTLLARRGYIVIAPDFRASAGYGRDWRTAIYRRMGTPELEDFDDCLAWLGEHRDADLDRVGIYGGSYGGFMTLMAMFNRPGVYRCGAALRPVTDWAHYNHGYTSNILNTPEIDPEAFERSSPIEHADGLAGALLMCHGLIDDNVVAQDTIRLAQRLIELKKENWEMMLYPVEPHGFREPASWLDEYRRILKLFEINLNDG